MLLKISGCLENQVCGLYLQNTNIYEKINHWVVTNIRSLTIKFAIEKLTVNKVWLSVFYFSKSL